MKLSLLSLFLIVAAKAASVAAVDLGALASHTPYDAYMRPVRQVLNSLPGEKTSMQKVQTLMRVGKGFRYSYTDPYNAALPSVTAATKAGDCKAKALWLCDQIGEESVRYVIGKARRTSKINQAWVMWQNEGRWWVLDPTNTSRPIPADQLGKSEYIPLYSWDKRGTYRHASTQMLTAEVASANSPVASRTARR